MESFHIRAALGEGTCTLFLPGESDLAVVVDIIEAGVLSLPEVTRARRCVRRIVWLVQQLRGLWP